MRWPIARLICHRELRDQLRDRRTLVMIVLLPLLLYPGLGIGVIQIAQSIGSQPVVVEVVGREYLPPETPYTRANLLLPVLSWFAVSPELPECASLAAASALAQAGEHGLGPGLPPLFVRDENDALVFHPNLLHSPRDAAWIQLREASTGSPDPESAAKREAPPDLTLWIPADCAERLADEGRPTLHLSYRVRDERSELQYQRVHQILDRWAWRLKESRLLHHGLRTDFDRTLDIRQGIPRAPDEAAAPQPPSPFLARLVPFLLVLWSLAGALYPAVDLCAGEKERGTMETLLISPASREEIVWGKFLAIWVISTASAFVNLASVGITSWQLARLVPGETIRLDGLAWCVLLLLPLSAFFSALCLSIGVYARSSKEGQYYLMPLFLGTMPLVLLTLSPGVELNAFYSLVPVTGVTLLMQQLMAPTSGPLTWLSVTYVLAPLMIYSWLSLRWAIGQFQREEVLFREAERINVGLWLRHLWRDKEPLPSTGQAWFCFGMIVLLRGLTLGLGRQMSPAVRELIDQLAFVATPPLFLALLLTTRPVDGLRLHRVSWLWLGIVTVLGLLLAIPAQELAAVLARHWPLDAELVSTGNWFLRTEPGTTADPWPLRLLVAAVAAVCEELAFRGLILSGMRRRLGPVAAVLVSSLLFALAFLNLVAFLPAFLLGCVLGFLALRTNSLWPGVVLQWVARAVLIFG